MTGAREPGRETELRLVRMLLVGSAIGASLMPLRLLHRAPGVCLFRRVFGLPCPTCGLTRSTVAAGHLRVRESVAYHPLGIPVLIGMWLAATGLLPLKRWLEDGLSPSERRLALLFAAALCLFGALRIILGRDRSGTSGGVRA